MDLTCVFCQHTWTRRWGAFTGQERVCPRCRSEHWNFKGDLAAFPLAPRSKIVRFLRKIRKTATCWLWTGLLWHNGYGRFGQQRAHRVAYRWAVGPIPARMTIDHVKARGCRQRACVRPDHLEPVPIGVNVLRGEGPSAKNSRKKKCPCGRPLVQIGPRKRGCPPCRRKRDREWRMAQRRAAGISDRRAGRPPLKD